MSWGGMFYTFQAAKRGHHTDVGGSVQDVNKRSRKSASHHSGSECTFPSSTYMRSKAAGFLTPGDGIELCGDEWRSEKDHCVTHNNRGTSYAYILWMYVHAHPEKYTPNKGGWTHNVLSYCQHVRTYWPMRFSAISKCRKTVKYSVPQPFNGLDLILRIFLSLRWRFVHKQCFSFFQIWLDFQSPLPELYPCTHDNM